MHEDKKMKMFVKPLMSISNIHKLSDSYKQGKAVAFLFTLDKLNHTFEGSAVSILNQMDKYLNAELKKLGAEITVDVDEFDIKKNNSEDIKVHLNMNRGNPSKEGTD